MEFRLVVVESPFEAETDEAAELHQRYARAAVRDCFDRGEAPIASHVTYTLPGILDDNIPAERVQGIVAGLAWAVYADVTVVYEDLGISPGMERAIAAARAINRPIEYRTLPEQKYKPC